MRVDCGLMNRVLLLVVALGAPTIAFARPARQMEAMQVLDQFFSGAMNVNTAVNRIEYLGEQRYATQEALFLLKRSSDRRQRAGLLEMIVALHVDDPDVERTELALIKGNEPGEVVVAARGLGRIRSEAAIKPLSALLVSESPGLRREVSQALGAIGKPAAGPALLKAMKAESDLETRLVMLVSIGRSGDKRQAGALEGFLTDGSESTRLAAAQALCSLGSPKCASFAQKLLASSDANERLQAVMLFEGASAKLAGPVLKPLLADTDDRLRARAARILAQGGDKAQVDWLVIEASKSKLEVRMIYEDQIEKLRLSDETRQAILKKAGLK